MKKLFFFSLAKWFNNENFSPMNLESKEGLTIGFFYQLILWVANSSSSCKAFKQEKDVLNSLSQICDHMFCEMYL
jgi:hypothetical protein